MMFTDLHMHSNFSDGRNSIEEMVEAAIGFGYDAIAITDHVWRTTGWVKEYAKRLRELKEANCHRIRLFSGIEAKVINLQGDIDAHPSFDGLVDLILGSVHSIPSGSGYYHRGDVNAANVHQVVEHWFQAFSNLLKNPRVDIIAHPFAELKEFGISPCSDKMENALRLLAESGKIVEINVRHEAPNQSVIDLLHHQHVPFVVSSDSHSVEDLKIYSERIRKFVESSSIQPVNIEEYVKNKKQSV
jgi:putative hydrolase